MAITDRDVIAPSIHYPLLSILDIYARPSISWVIRHILPSDAVAMLYGRPGSMKTFIVLDWLFHLATGIDWNGNRVQQGHVVYIAGEGVGGLKLRLRAWLESHPHAIGIRLEDVLPYFHIVDRIVPLLDAREVDLLITESLAPLGDNIACVAIDTLSKATIGSNENDNSVIAGAIANADRIRRHTHALTLIVHHDGKAGTGPRGASSMMGNVDVLMSVHREEKSEFVTIGCHKQKDGHEEFADITMRREIITFADEPDNSTCIMHSTRETKPPVDKLTGKNRDALLTMILHFPNGATYSDWERGSKQTASTFKRTRKFLDTDGYVEDRDGVYCLTEKGEEWYISFGSTGSK